MIFRKRITVISTTLIILNYNSENGNLLSDHPFRRKRVELVPNLNTLFEILGFIGEYGTETAIVYGLICSTLNYKRLFRSR